MDKKRASMSARERDAMSLMRKLVGQGGFLRASIVRMKRKCGNANCRCAKGELHKSWYLYQSNKGKSRMLFVPDDYLCDVKAWVKNNKDVRKSLDKISQIYWDKIKNREM